jgi:hypothetical protein
VRGALLVKPTGEDDDSQRLTDAGAGSTFYDNRVDVRAG